MMMSNDLTLWGVGTSRTIRAHWMLLELGLDYVCHPIRSRTGETLTDEFRRLNPRHKIPVLQHKSFVLTESAAIVQYLSETFANPTQVYVADDARSRATLNEWCYFIMSELDAGSLYVVRRHEGLAQTYGEAPAAVESAKTYFLHNLEAMIPRIVGESPYLFGDRLSAADILLMTCLEWAALAGISLPDSLSPYRQRIGQRPAFQAAMKKNFPKFQS
jgi:glutathione S-transferase